MTRLENLCRFYDLMDQLRIRLGGTLTLDRCSGRLGWPQRGVYFLFENHESRSDSEAGLRVVRVGTHALSLNSRTTLWNRLAQHAGSKKSGAGNHRGSIFRLLVGEALKNRAGVEEPKSWGFGSHPGEAGNRLGMTTAEIRAQEHDHERAVSCYICAMPFLFVAASDAPGPGCDRALIERNSIALLSNYRREPIDAASAEWLGRSSGRDRVRASGLWNSNHVDEACDPTFLSALTKAIKQTVALSL